jgi:hypothetical protein
MTLYGTEWRERGFGLWASIGVMRLCNFVCLVPDLQGEEV